MSALRLVLLGLAALLLATTALVMAVRLPYPFELEWMEGATVIHVARLLASQPLYPEPSLSFVPLAYPPLYYYACAPLAWLTGVGYLPLRLVSAAATVVTLAAIFAVVRRTSGASGGLVAVAAFAGAYAASDGWFDLARVDALYVAMLALVYAAAIRARTDRDWVIAGALAVLAFMTKQPALVALAPFGVYLLVRERRGALWFCGTFIVLAGASFLVMDASSGGWYSYYVFQLPRLRVGVSARTSRLFAFWSADMLPFAIALGAGFVVAIRKREWRHVALASGLILSAWAARLEGGAWNNALLPAHLALAILLGLALRPDVEWQGARTALAMLQLTTLIYDPRPLLPASQHRADSEAFVQALRAMKPPILLLDHSYWATQAGLREFAHGWAVTDVVWADRARVGPRLEAEFVKAIADRRFTAIVVDDERTWFFATIEAHYERTGEIRAPLPLSGAPRHARYVYQPRSPGEVLRLP
jgi:4-amino-4-deoxy-L-arabinose transferase-like glycosyltransferase